MCQRLIWTCMLLAVTPGGSSRFAALGAGENAKEGAGIVVFPLREISILDSSLDQSLLRDLSRGARAELQEGPVAHFAEQPEWAGILVGRRSTQRDPSGRRRVPEDIDLAEGKETFTITVRYDTQALYGKVEATRTFVVESK